MKKILMMCGVALMMSSPAIADEYNTYKVGDNTVRTTPLTGAYVGVLAGYTNANTDDSVAGTDPEVKGGDYGVFAGYKVDALLDNTINRTGLGLNGAIEMSYVWSGADDRDGGIEYEKNNEFGLSFRPGLSILNNLTPFDVNPYGIIGYKRTEFEADAGSGIAGSEDFDGFELGIGTELVAYDNVGVRLDYSHTWYEEIGGVDPSEDSIRVGLAYHF